MHALTPVKEWQTWNNFGHLGVSHMLPTPSMHLGMEQTAVSFATVKLAQMTEQT
jgi:hypothetical protein